MSNPKSSKLLIVESPGKLKTLRQILGPGWILEASVGHTTELAHDGPKRMGFDLVADSVTTRYVPRGDRGKQVLAKLRHAAKLADEIYLATDPDREGEAIAWHLVQQLKLKNYCRVSYTQITEAAVKKAIQNPGRLNFSLIESQRARQCLDKLVGFEVSPLLWNSTGGKSAGRVQSSTLHIVCERERERLAFKPEKYWTLHSSYFEGFEATFGAEAAAASTVTIRGPKSGLSDKERAQAPAAVLAPDRFRIKSEDEAKVIAEVARTSTHVVSNTDQKEEHRPPPPPFITSTLQQMAGARFKYSPKQSMQIAQDLYEGIQGKGLITYMRTDSVSLSPEFVHDARDWLSAYSPESLGQKSAIHRVSSDAQSAHEAIRPTSASLTPDDAARILSKEQLNVYRLIWERAIASQCKAARLSKTQVTVHCANTRWIARGMSVMELGYLKFWKNTEDEKILPALHVGQKLGFKDVRIEARSTEPPPRFTEPKLVQMMELRGIGRPSTYASTLATIKDREYVALEKGFIVPTDLGLATDEALGRAIPDLVNPDFTAKMESALDEIAEGKLAWEKYLTGWNRSYLEPAVMAAHGILSGTARVAPERTFGARNAGVAASRVASGDSIKRPRRGKGRTSGTSSDFGSKKVRTSGVSRGTGRATQASPRATRVSKWASRPEDERGGVERGGIASAATEGTGPNQAGGSPALADALRRARENGALPICTEGHGELDLKVSKKGGFYWKCLESRCESWAWYQELSDQSCPDCGLPLEKIPSAKVTGGHFLKCARKAKHPGEIVMFRDRNSGQWVKANSTR